MSSILDSPSAIQDHLRYTIVDFDDPGVRFVLCDEDREVRAHVHIGENPPEPALDECLRAVAAIAHGLPGEAAMLLAMVRPGPVALVPVDRLWFQAAHEVCAQHGVDMLGVHLVTPHGTREIVLDDVL